MVSGREIFYILDYILDYLSCNKNQNCLKTMSNILRPVKYCPFFFFQTGEEAKAQVLKDRPDVTVRINLLERDDPSEYVPCPCLKQLCE